MPSLHRLWSSCTTASTSDKWCQGPPSHLKHLTQPWYEPTLDHYIFGVQSSFRQGHRCLSKITKVKSYGHLPWHQQLILQDHSIQGLPIAHNQPTFISPPKFHATSRMSRAKCIASSLQLPCVLSLHRNVSFLLLLSSIWYALDLQHILSRASSACRLVGPCTSLAHLSSYPSLGHETCCFPRCSGPQFCGDCRASSGLRDCNSHPYD